MRYIDDAVVRQVSAAFTDSPAAGEFPAVLSVNWDDAIDEEEGRTAKRWWYLTDVQFSVVGLIDPTWGSMVTERVEYSPYGVPLYQPATDFDGDGDVDTADEFAFLDAWYAQFGGSGIGPGPASADRDRSGAVDVGDLFDFLDAWFADFPVGGPGAPEGWISRKEVPPSMGVQDGPLGPDNPVGYCGYIHNNETGDDTVRFRHYSPRLGRWLERDPKGYVNGWNLLEYVASEPADYSDALGLDIHPCGDEGLHHCPCEICNPPRPIGGPGSSLRCNILFWHFSTKDERNRILIAIERARNRARQLSQEIVDAASKLSPCVLAEVSVDLDELRKRMDDLQKRLADEEKRFDISQRLLPSGIEAETTGYSEGFLGIIAFQPCTTINNAPGTDWHTLTDDQLAALMLHEFSHVVEGNIDYDGSGMIYDLHNVNSTDGFYYQNLEDTAAYQFLIKRARRRCGEDNCHDSQEVPTTGIESGDANEK